MRKISLILAGAVMLALGGAAPPAEARAAAEIRSPLVEAGHRDRGHRPPPRHWNRHYAPPRHAWRPPPPRYHGRGYAPPPRHWSYRHGYPRHWSPRRDWRPAPHYAWRRW